MSTTDTPRTDEICLRMAETDYETREGQQVLLLAHFSRQLEAELIAEIANRKQCCLDGNKISDELFDTQQKLKKAEAAVEKVLIESLGS